MADKRKNTEEKLDRTSLILLVFYALFFVLGLLIIGKIVYIQFFWELPKNSLEEFIPNYEETIIKPERGDILDRNGKILASSAPFYTLRMDCCIQKDILSNGKKIKVGQDSIGERDWREMAWKMCQELPKIVKNGKTAEEYYSLIIRNRESSTLPGRRNMKLVTGISHSDMSAIRKLPLIRHGRNVSGMKEEKAHKRVYPYRGLAERVIGDIRFDPANPERNRNIGLDGQYDYILHGKEGRQWMKSTDNGKVVNPDSVVIAVENGSDIRTTIDISIQDIADRAIRKYISEDAGIEGACAVVMEVETGAVRAMANLKKNSAGVLKESLNMAIGRSGAPGSIFKTVTLMTLLEDKKVTLDTKVETNGGILKEYPKLAVDKQLKTYIENTGNKEISVREGLAISSNNVFRHLVIEHYGESPEKIKQFTDRLYEYKLDGSYSFDLKEDAYGRPSLRDSWTIHDLYSTAIGYSIRQTPLSMLTFYNAIANKGRMMKPYLIESFEKNGVVEKVFEPEILNGSICSMETADSLTSALKLVAMEGTAARRMKGARCEVAGKTGTAWIYLEPQDKPIKGRPFETENGERKYQATFVGFFPADSPKYSAIVTVYTTLTKSLGYGGGNQPTLIFRDIADHIWAMDNEWGETIKETYSMPYMKERYIGTRQSAAPVPDLTGLGLKDAVYMLENNGYKCTFEGMGLVIGQSIEAGTTGRKGETIHIILE